MIRTTQAIWMGLLLIALSTSACGGCADPDPNNVAADLGGDDVTFDVGDAGPTQPDSDTPDATPPGDLFVFDFGQRDTGGDTGPIVLRLDAVVPPRGPLQGGTQFVASGSGFSRDTAIFFGSANTPVELIDGALVGQVPPGQGPGPVNVKVLDPVLGEEILVGGYEYTLDLEVESVTPNRVPSEGGVEVTIRGRGFDEFTRVSFGGATGVRHDIVDDRLMRVIVPPHAAGVFDVRATNRNATTIAAAAIEYFDAVRVDRVRPATGDTAGGDSVVVEGAGFVPNTTFQFDGAPAAIASVDPSGNLATVTTPPRPAGLVNVRAANPDGDAHIAPDAFYYASPGEFTLAAVMPNQGAAVGGTEVTLLGAGLDAATLTVTFDGIPATILDQGPGHAQVQTPAHAVGSVDVSISAGATNDTLVNGFTYVDNLWIDRVTPDSGDVAGGFDVVIEGEGFTGATQVRFGTIAAGFTVDSPTQITAQAPAHSAGVVDVVVERDQVTATFVDAFTFTEPLEVYGFTPVRGSIAGNTYVEIRGRGFVGNPGVTFDGLPGGDVQILDAQTLSVRTPPHATGSVALQVNVGAQSVVAPLPYTYFNPGSRFGGAWGGPVAGAVNVTVYSTDGQPLEGAFVMLSTNPGTPYQGSTDANGMVTMSGPDVFGAQTVTATYKLFIEARPCNPEISWTSSATVQDVDAENITIFLDLDPPPPLGAPSMPEPDCTEGEFECWCRLQAPLCDDVLECNPFTGVCCPPPPERPARPSATFTGYLSGLDKLAEPGPNEFQMAIVYTTQRDPFSQNPPTGDGNVVLTNGNYTLLSRIGDVALIAVGGLYNNSTQTFRPLMMGVERFLFASDGMTYTVDLDLNVPLDTQLSFKLNHVPQFTGGPNLNEVVPYLDLGFEGVFGGVDIATGTSDVIIARHQAALSGVFADARYQAIGGSYTNGTVPMTIGIKRGITNTGQVIQIPGLAGIANVTSPPDGGIPVSGLIEWELQAPNEPDFYYMNIAVPTLTGLKTLWLGFMPAGSRSMRLPDFPDLSSLPQVPSPYPPGTYILDIIGVQKPGFQWETFNYNDLGIGEWESYSYSRRAVAF